MDRKRKRVMAFRRLNWLFWSQVEPLGVDSNTVIVSFRETSEAFE